MCHADQKKSKKVVEHLAGQQRCQIPFFCLIFQLIS